MNATGRSSLRACLAAAVLVTAASAPVHAQINFVLQDNNPVTGALKQFGPVDSFSGWPLWAMDRNGVILSLCLDTTVIPDPLAPLDPLAACPLCLDPALDLPNGDLPLSFPDNFTEEAFYMQATALMDTNNGGRALLVIALEAAFDGLGTVVDGQQIVFSRLRVRIDNASAGTYRITHPYGIVDVVAEGTGPRGINISNDLFLWSALLGNLADPLIANFGTFLTADVPFVLPDGTALIGNPCGDTTVTGSPFLTNFFRVEGPNITDATNPFACADITLGPDPNSFTDCIETDLFTLLANPVGSFGAQIDRATYRRDAVATQIDVWARGGAGSILELSAPGIPTTTMLSDGEGNFYAHAVHSSTVPPPAQVTVTNITDNPPTHSTVDLVDAVAIPIAKYDLDALDPVTLLPSPALTVEATSSRADGGLAAGLTLGVGPALPPGSPALTLAANTAGAVSHTIGGVVIPPTSVTATSSFGGSVEVPVVVVSSVAAPLAASAANIVAVPGSTVTLDGSQSNGAIDFFQWTQLSGPTVALTPALGDAPIVTFVMPALPPPPAEPSILLTFQLSVTGAGGSSATTVTVASPVTANAGPDQAVPAAAIVTLDGTGSQGAQLNFLWTQANNPDGTTGPAITLSNPTVAQPTFTFPLVGGQVTFQLTVSGPGGTQSDFVTITAPPGVPIANAGDPQTVFVGDLVQLDGGLSEGIITDWVWTQVVGPSTPLCHFDQFANVVCPGDPGFQPPPAGFPLGAGPNIPNPVFLFPDQLATTIRWQLVVTGPGGTSVAPSTVDITATDPFAADTITVDPNKAQWDSAKGAWRIEGITTIPGPGNDVQVFLGNPNTPGTLIGVGITDPSGRFKVQSDQGNEGTLIDPTVPGAPGVLTAVSQNGGVNDQIGFTIK